jgi:diaminopropionate ammonia-lyase
MQKILIQSEYQLTLNPQYESHSLYPREAETVLNADGFSRAKQSISQWPGYAPTPLLELSDLARELDVASLYYKDESSRFDLGSFKPLGGAYAVASLLQKQIGERQGGRKPDISELLAGQHHHTAIDITVTAATDGNHGRSVAWGAQLFGCRCIIFIHETVTNAREHAIAGYGAEVIRTPGTFDDAVRKAAETAKMQGWHVIPDTSDGTAIEAPRNVMQGYTLMAAEAIEQLPQNRAPTHLFLQAGVGGMAAATCAQFWQTFSEHTPAIILVEPQTAGCWFDSLSAGHPTAVAGSLQSIMAGLACGEVSYLAWKILRTGASAMMTISDTVAEKSMRLLADQRRVDPPVVAGESGVAGLAGLIEAASDQQCRIMLGLDEKSRVLVFGTEGATDPESYHKIVGRPAHEVASGRHKL